MQSTEQLIKVLKSAETGSEMLDLLDKIASLIDTKEESEPVAV